VRRPRWSGASRARVGLLLALCLALGGCGGGGPRTFEGANVVVVGIDTLRADHLGCYGYPRPTSPRLDALSRESVLFTTAIAQAPWTLPSFASMLTGLLPSNHGAGDGLLLDDELFVFTTPVPPLSPDHRTLATILQEAGYRTGSFVSNGFVGKRVGLQQGFTDTFEWFTSDASVNQAVNWLNQRGPERFFLFVHIVDPHAPYTPSDEDAKPFLDPAYAGMVGTSYNGRANPFWNDADRRRIVDLYDGEVHYADRLVGQLLDTLRERGLLEKTLFVVVSDHGEELVERGTLGHGHSLYDELIHVPLIVRFPHAGFSGRIDAQVRAMDIFPTVLDAVGMPVPAGIDAASLMPLVRGEAPSLRSDLAVAEAVMVKPERKAIRQRDRKLVVEPGTGQMMLFDLAADRAEHTNIAAQRPDEVKGLRAQLEQTLLDGAAGFQRQEGYQLLVRGDKKDSHRVRVRLKTRGRFSDPVLFEPEAGDRVRLSDDGSRLDVQLLLPALETPDRDGIRFRLDGADGVTVQAIMLDDARLPADRLFLGRRVVGKGGPTAAFTVDGTSIREPFATFPPIAQGGGVSVGLQLVRPGPPSGVSLDEKTRENLRALGYVQ
jgi:arylsulfatase A-like enzyme